MKKIILMSVLALGLIGCDGGSSSKPTVASKPAASTPASSSTASSLTLTSSSSAHSSMAAGWNLVWSDEFEGSTIDTTKWSFERNCTGGGNNELQCYTDRADNAYLADGSLHIVAKKEIFKGQAKNDDDPAYSPTDTSVTRDYTSARLRTKNKGDWKYGRMDIRAKLPQGQGIWPAIWMLPTEWKYGGWPLSGEIDIMEAINSNTGTNGSKVYGTLHYGDLYPNNKNEGTSTTPSTNIWDNFHNYTVEWQRGEIRFYVDNIHYATQTKKGWYTKGSTVDGAPFDQLFHMILNIAVGGGWPGNPDSKTIFPQEMQVDYVRVYQCNLDIYTGTGCASNVNPAIDPLKGHTQVGSVFAPPPLFTMYNDELDIGLNFNSYNPDSTISYSQVVETGRGKVLNVVKTGPQGNVYFTIKSGASDLKAWSQGGILVFDVKINSMTDGVKLLVKMDSGWPSVSDTVVTLPATGTWGEYRINVSDLIAKGNSIVSGIANLAAITNIFVIEPTGAMDVSFDNIRLEKP
jgi:beta-glucanase (GH16 family)